MDKELKSRLEILRLDYQKLVKKPFTHFFCPLLYEDVESTLCKGHIVNLAFPNSSKYWVVQRKDIDNFYGSNFESDFVLLQYRDSQCCPKQF